MQNNTLITVLFVFISNATAQGNANNKIFQNKVIPLLKNHTEKVSDILQNHNQ